MSWPQAEFDVSPHRVRARIDAQFPHLARESLRTVGEGFDNVLYRIGDDFVARFPRRRVAAQLIEHEIKWLPTIAARLPVPVPVPLHVGEPGVDYPTRWLITRWYDGETADVASYEPDAHVALALSGLLSSLHHTAPSDAPRNPLRGVPLVDRVDSFEERLIVVADHVDVRAVQEVWDEALGASPFTGEPVWLHGDLHPGNVLINSGRLHAVLDFGDMCAGDPATDLAGAWMLLRRHSIDAVLSSYCPSATDLVARSRGWAALFALFFIDLGLTSRPSYLRIGRRTLENLFA